jgi:uncharacterized protein YecE (DUF72 family)
MSRYDDFEDEFPLDDELAPTYASEPRHARRDMESMLDTTIGFVQSAKLLPLANQIRISRDELIELLLEVRDAIPEEVRQARWELREREARIAETQVVIENMLADAEERRRQLVSQAQVVRAAEAKAREIVNEAHAEVRTMHNQVKDYYDQQLARLEDLLDRAQQAVGKGRAQFAGQMDSFADQNDFGPEHDDDLPPAAPAYGYDGASGHGDDEIFDQDEE